MLLDIVPSGQLCMFPVQHPRQQPADPFLRHDLLLDQLERAAHQLRRTKMGEALQVAVGLVRASPCRSTLLIQMDVALKACLVAKLRRSPNKERREIGINSGGIRCFTISPLCSLIQYGRVMRNRSQRIEQGNPLLRCVARFAWLRRQAASSQLRPILPTNPSSKTLECGLIAGLYDQVFQRVQIGNNLAEHMVLVASPHSRQHVQKLCDCLIAATSKRPLVAEQSHLLAGRQLRKVGEYLSQQLAVQALTVKADLVGVRIAPLDRSLHIERDPGFRCIKELPQLVHTGRILEAQHKWNHPRLSRGRHGGRTGKESFLTEVQGMAVRVKRNIDQRMAALRDPALHDLSYWLA